MCSHHSGCDEELLLSSLSCSLCDGLAGFLALFFCWNAHEPSPWLFCSETGTLPLLTEDLLLCFQHLIQISSKQTQLSVGLAFRQPLLEGLMLTEPCIPQHPQEAHFVLTAIYFALRISSDFFPLESASRRTSSCRGTGRCDRWTESRFQGMIVKILQPHTGFSHSQSETRITGKTWQKPRTKIKQNHGVPHPQIDDGFFSRKVIGNSQINRITILNSWKGK